MRQLLICFLLLLPCSLQAAIMRMGLKAALSSQSVTLQATGSGQRYYGKGLHLQLKNRSGQPLKLDIDPGLIFRPDDTSYQDLVLPGEQTIVLAANGEAGIDLQSFCGKSYARAPGAHTSFTFQKQGDSAMIRVLQFINKYQLYNSAGQHAVWVLTNDKDLDGIYDPQQPQVSNKLLALLVQLTGKPIPPYFKLYRLSTVAGEPVLEPRVLKIYSIFEWQLTSTKNLTMGVYDASGELIQPVWDNKPFVKGGYKMTVAFEAENIAPGNYYIRLKDGTELMREQMVRVE